MTPEDTTRIDDDRVSASNDTTEDTSTLRDNISSDNLLCNIAHDDTTVNITTEEDNVLDQTNYLFNMCIVVNAKKIGLKLIAPIGCEVPAVSFIVK